MIVRAAHRFTVEDYHRMAETGVIKPDARVELLEGEIVDMMPTGPFHGGTVKKLNRLFSSASKGRWIVAVQDPIRLGPHSEPQPDLMLLKPSPDDYTSRHPTAEDVFLLIEVADSTVQYDCNAKLPAYGRAGVPEVWLINLPEQTIEVYREPHFSGYSSVTKLRAGETARTQVFPDVSIEIGSLLRHAT